MKTLQTRHTRSLLAALIEALNNSEVNPSDWEQRKLSDERTVVIYQFAIPSSPFIPNPLELIDSMLPIIGMPGGFQNVADLGQSIFITLSTSPLSDEDLFEISEQQQEDDDEEFDLDDEDDLDDEENEDELPHSEDEEEFIFEDSDADAAVAPKSNSVVVQLHQPAAAEEQAPVAEQSESEIEFEVESSQTEPQQEPAAEQSDAESEIEFEPESDEQPEAEFEPEGSNEQSAPAEEQAPAAESVDVSSDVNLEPAAEESSDADPRTIELTAALEAEGYDVIRDGKTIIVSLPSGETMIIVEGMREVMRKNVFAYMLQTEKDGESTEKAFLTTEPLLRYIKGFIAE